METCFKNYLHFRKNDTFCVIMKNNDIKDKFTALKAVWIKAFFMNIF